MSCSRSFALTCCSGKKKKNRNQANKEPTAQWRRQEASRPAAVALVIRRRPARRVAAASLPRPQPAGPMTHDRGAYAASCSPWLLIIRRLTGISPC